MLFDADPVFAVDDDDFDPADRIDMLALRNVEDVDYDDMWDETYEFPDDYIL